MGFYDDVFKSEVDPSKGSNRFEEKAPLEEPQPKEESKPEPRKKPKRKVKQVAGPPTALRSCIVLLGTGRKVRLVKGEPVEGLPEADAKRLKKHRFVK